MKNFWKILYIGFWIFLTGSIFGFIFEGVLEVIRHGTWVNRQGLLYGPFSQVYGIGAVVLWAFLYKIKRPFFLFVTGTIIGGAVEYILSLLQEYVFGTISWDYSNYLFHINGRTSLFHSLMWGVIAFLFIKYFLPILIKLCEKLQNKIGYTITIIFCLFLIIDIFLSIFASIRQEQRKNNIQPKSPIEFFIDKHYPNERMDKIYNNKTYRR